MQNLNDDKSTIPKYLEELVKPTPLSVEKLLAAWDGLSFETQLTILSEYVSTYPQHYRNKICLKSISSKNEYVRLVSKNIGIFPNYKDSSLLVSSNYYLPKWCIPLPDNPIYSPEKFLNLNQIERLIIVSTIDGFGEEIAGIVKYYYTHRENLKNTSEEQVFDILCEYFKGSGFDRYKSGEMSFDGYDEFLKGEAIAAFWELIPIVSESIAYLLIENLPAKSGFKSFTEDIIPNLPEKYFIWFLSNKNNHVSEFRKSIFKSDDYSHKIKEAAICCHFCLNEYEFLEIVKCDTKKRLSVIESLVFASDMSICCLKAVADLLRLETDVDYMSIRICNQNVSRKFNQISSEYQSYQLNLIRLYEIAKRILPWKETNQREFNFPSEVGFLKFDTTGLNTWEIFVKIKEKFDLAYKSDDEITIVLDKLVDVEESRMVFKEDKTNLLLKKFNEKQDKILNQLNILKQDFDLKSSNFQTTKLNNNDQEIALGDILNFIQKIDFADIKTSVLSSINDANKNQEIFVKNANEKIKMISDQISGIVNNNQSFASNSWLIFALISVSFISGFGFHWFMTK